jgi:hypothetical protein
MNFTWSPSGSSDLTLKVGVGETVAPSEGESKTGTDGGRLPGGGGCPPPPPQPFITNIIANIIKQIDHLIIAFHLTFSFFLLLTAT